MITLNSTKKKTLTAVVIFTILVTVEVAFLQINQTAQASVIHPQVDVPTGLSGWWRFSEGVGVLAKDSSEFENDGTIYGATWVDGKYDKALTFDGSASYVLIPHDSSLSSSEISVEAWVKRTRTGVEEMVVSKYGGDYKEYYLFVNSGDTLCFLIGNGTDNVIAFSTVLLDQTDVWYFVGGTYDGVNMRVYVNGVDTTSGSPTQDPISHNVGGVTIGKASWYDGQFFEGVIDEVRIFNRTLSGSEILADYEKDPNFTSEYLAVVPKGTTQVIATIVWQGIETINATLESPSTLYTEENTSVYQKTTYLTSEGMSTASNVKRMSISVTALVSDENWQISLEFENIESYRISVEVQK